MSGQSIFSAILDLLLKPGEALFNGAERIFWMYLVSSLALAIIVYVRGQQTRSVKAFVGYVFPKEVYRHRSSLADYQFLLVAFAIVGVMAPAVGAISHAISSHVQSSIGRAAVPTIHVGAVPGTIVYTLWLALTLDFSLFLGHWLEHFVPWLWEFHKTHHSAEKLNPITVYRMHPLDTLFTFVVTGVVLGVSDGMFQSFVRGNYAEVIVFSINIAFFAFYLVGYNLRHTHVWLDYGPRWSRVFVSPALHQIHHSVDERHYNKNMGFLFSFWDALFGTLYVPEKEETLEFGINRQGEHTEYHSVWALLMKPFNKIGIPSAVVIIVILIGTAAWLDWRLAPPGWLTKHEDEKVALADLTSPEVREKIAAGYTTVIVPTGGFEQGGPHLVLGKHDYVVDYTADQIARELGHTLVAPVLPFSPAGSIDPPSEHMLFPGTISLQGPAFSEVLEAEARSLKRAGFTMICIVSDHGSSLPFQDEVAKKLNEEWQDAGVRVVAVDDYYAKNGQAEALRIEGVSDADIGQHAGIRDTSELWRVKPSGVRPELRIDSHDFDHTGVDGNALKASPELGERFLRMKINAAVGQIREAQKERTRSAGGGH